MTAGSDPVHQAGGDRRMFFLFLDGVGIGRENDPDNPFFSHHLPHLTSLMGGTMISTGSPGRSNGFCSVLPLDATLGVRGLPQSGTGQTALLTGVNAPAVLGRHFGPYPHSALREILGRDNIFRKLSAAGRRVSYANAFPRQYFTHLDAHPMRASAISIAWRLAGFQLNTHAELLSGRALSSDCTGAGWVTLGYPDVVPVSPGEAAGRALRLLDDTHFVLFEYYLTDHAGHGRSQAGAGKVLATVDEFVGAFIRGMDPGRHAFVLTSDHGNLEDLSTKRHSLNPVPFLCAGHRHREVSRELRSLTDVPGAVLRYFS